MALARETRLAISEIGVWDEAARARRRRIARRWLTGYLIVLFGTVPIAVPWWNGFLQSWVGRFLTVEAAHVVQYAGLGWVGAVYARTITTLRRRWGLAVLLAMAGLLDEMVQGWLPQRVFQWSDVGLNGLGLLLGFTIGGAAHHIGLNRADTNDL